MGDWFGVAVNEAVCAALDISESFSNIQQAHFLWTKNKRKVWWFCCVFLIIHYWCVPIFRWKFQNATLIRSQLKVSICNHAALLLLLITIFKVHLTLFLTEPSQFSFKPAVQNFCLFLLAVWVIHPNVVGMLLLIRSGKQIFVRCIASVRHRGHATDSSS